MSKPIGGLLTGVVWLLVAIVAACVVQSFRVSDSGWGVAGAGVAILTGVLVGRLQSRATIKALAEAKRPATARAEKGPNHEAFTVLLTEYSEVRSTRNLASESGARLFQYYQVAIVASLALILPDANVDIFGLTNLRGDVHSVLLALTALLLSVLAADILHWHLDVMALEDYQERVLRPRLTQEVGEAVLQSEQHIASIRDHGDWRLRDLTDLSRKSWVDPFVLKELGHVVVLGLPGIAVATDAYWHAHFSVGLVVLALVVGIYCASVWASYWSAAFTFVEWRAILRGSWEETEESLLASRAMALKSAATKDAGNTLRRLWQSAKAVVRQL